MNRKQAIKIIASDEIENLSIEDRELIIYNAWGLDKTDKEFPLLSSNLKKELLNFDEPQHDVEFSEYDELVKISCESSYDEYSNEQLAIMVSDILKKKYLLMEKILKDIHVHVVEKKHFQFEESMIFVLVVIGRMMGMKMKICIVVLII